MDDSTRTTQEEQGGGSQPREIPPQAVHGAPQGDGKPVDDSQAAPRYGDSRKRRLADCPPKFRKLYRRAWGGKSRQSAIRAHCLECVGWSPREVALCTAPACPLYEYRGARA